MKKIKERVFEANNIPAEYLVELPKFPKKAKVEATSRCDLKCFYCSHTYKQIKKGDIDRKFLFRILQELKDIGVEEVGLFWIGEPLLVKDLPEYVAYAKKIGLEYVFITTNGRLATPDRIQQLFDSGLDSIKFSINAGNRTLYQKSHGVDAFDTVVSNIKSAWNYRGDRRKPAIYASSIFDPDTKNDFEEINSIIDPYVDEHYPLRMYGEYSFLRENDNQGIFEPVPNDIGRTLSSMLPCWSLFTIPHISFDGYMSACYCDHDEKYYFGNLNEISLIEAWHSKDLAALRRQHIAKAVKGTVCEDCIAYTV